MHLIRPKPAAAAKAALEVEMTTENKIRAFAGTFILAGLLLAHFVSPYFLWAVAFVGANLLQSAFTKFCPLENILRKSEDRS